METYSEVSQVIRPKVSIDVDTQSLLSYSFVNCAEISAKNDCCKKETSSYTVAHKTVNLTFSCNARVRIEIRNSLTLLSCSYLSSSLPHT